ncbi:MAG: hypothetical protein R2867_17630 [Caldilineaceae bacterium]
MDDKTEIYIDLIQLLLDLAADDPTRMADAFAAVERARSRALLERLLAATSGEAVDVVYSQPKVSMRVHAVCN